MTTPLTLKTLPLLDLSRLDGEARQRRAFLDGLRAAARDVGFFYLRGHGVDPALNAGLQQCARRFFALPEPTSWRCRWCIRRIFAAITARRRS